MIQDPHTDCRNYVNCGGFAEPRQEYCENCLEEQAEIEAEESEKRGAIKELKDALAVGDNTLIVKAARKVAELH